MVKVPCCSAKFHKDCLKTARNNAVDSGVGLFTERMKNEGKKTEERRAFDCYPIGGYGLIGSGSVDEPETVHPPMRSHQGWKTVQSLACPTCRGKIGNKWLLGAKKEPAEKYIDNPIEDNSFYGDSDADSDYSLSPLSGDSDSNFSDSDTDENYPLFYADQVLADWTVNNECDCKCCKARKKVMTSFSKGGSEADVRHLEFVFCAVLSMFLFFYEEFDKLEIMREDFEEFKYLIDGSYDEADDPCEAEYR